MCVKPSCASSQLQINRVPVLVSKCTHWKSRERNSLYHQAWLIKIWMHLSKHDATHPLLHAVLRKNYRSTSSAAIQAPSVENRVTLARKFAITLQQKLSHTKEAGKLQRKMSLITLWLLIATGKATNGIFLLWKSHHVVLLSFNLRRGGWREGEWEGRRAEAPFYSRKISSET